MNGNIIIRNARENNLKGIDVEIPRSKLVVITGVSGSGKSSLAFDTLFAEGQRRFAESLSAFARQFLGRMSKPAVDMIEGIPPAIAIGQKVNTSNPRSTVGTSTEIYDYFKLLFARIGRTFSPISGREVRCDTARSVCEHILSLPEGTVVNLLAALRQSTDSPVEMLLDLKKEGFSRICTVPGNGGEPVILKIDNALQDISALERGRCWILVDRLESEGSEDNRAIILDSVQTAFKHGDGTIAVLSGNGMVTFSSTFKADGMVFSQPDETMFNFNSPLGACPTCGGFGKITGVDEQLVIPDPSLSVYDDAVACWKGEVMCKYKEQLVNNAWRFDFPIHRPYRELTDGQKKTLWNGNDFFTGIYPFFAMVEEKKYKIQYKYMLTRYSGRTVCPECRGARLRREALWVRIGGKNISELMSMTITGLLEFFKGLELDDYDRSVGARPIKEIVTRLEYIDSVGLGYLTPDRPSNTLSGGESQRINLVSSLSSNLVGSLYILDEPSIGLHSRDTQKLIAVLKRLRDLGNTVVVVEHDEQIIRAADCLIDIGPGAGSLGGETVFCGSLADLPVSTEAGGRPDGGRSLTLDYLTGLRKVERPSLRRTPCSFIELLGASHNNLKDIDVRFPLHCLTVVTGVSGSGKSSLVGETLYPALYRRINQMGEKPGRHRALTGAVDHITAVEYVDQNPIGKNARSNPATYIKVYDDIRKLFSEQPYAKLNGYGHSHFSFNIDGGRCPDCQGEGIIHVEMQFMADVTMVCESCGGQRFLPDILEVKYKGRNINDVLNMSVDQAWEFFSSQDDATARRIADKLRPLQAVGLGYVKLGQSSSSLSGGESQRVKLASFLSKDDGKENRHILFIFDEPTTGLHFHDINKLLSAFSALLAKGHSIIVVEHNLDVIRAADWEIELGPEAGDNGGTVIYEGVPKE